MGVFLLTQGWSEPFPALAPGCVVPSLLSCPDCRLCGATGALATHVLVHSKGSQVPHTPTLVPPAPAGGQAAKLGVNWMLNPLLSPALSPAPSYGSAGMLGRAEPGLQIVLLRGCR